MIEHHLSNSHDNGFARLENNEQAVTSYSNSAKNLTNFIPKAILRKNEVSKQQQQTAELKQSDNLTFSNLKNTKTNKSGSHIICTVHLLDDTVREFKVDVIY